MRADLPPPLYLPGEDQPSSPGAGTPRPWLPTPGTYRYFAAAAAGCGVPAFWVPDAVGDMVLAAWRDGKADPLSVRRNAIDAARRYGQSRYGHRPAFVSLTDALYLSAPMPEPDQGLRAALAALTAKQRHALMRRLNGLPMSGLDSRHASTARHRLRELLCA